MDALSAGCVRRGMLSRGWEAVSQLLPWGGCVGVGGEPDWSWVLFSCVLLAENLPGLPAHLITRPLFSCVWKSRGLHGVGVRKSGWCHGACVLL